MHAGPEHVSAVMVNGAWVLRDGRILAFDEAAALSAAADAHAEIRERVGTLPEQIRGALPALSRSLQRWQAPQ